VWPFIDEATAWSDVKSIATVCTRSLHVTTERDKCMRDVHVTTRSKRVKG
jgi:hypothetical protein